MLWVLGKKTKQKQNFFLIFFETLGIYSQDFCETSPKPLTNLVTRTSNDELEVAKSSTKLHIFKSKGRNNLRIILSRSTSINMAMLLSDIYCKLLHLLVQLISFKKAPVSPVFEKKIIWHIDKYQKQSLVLIPYNIPAKKLYRRPYDLSVATS